MKEFDSPTYVLDFRNSLNRATIESAKPNKELRVLVIPEGDLSAEPIRAIGQLNANSTVFQVTVVTTAGKQTHSWTWSALQDKLGSYRDS